jgi:hypothetical protein
MNEGAPIGAPSFFISVVDKFERASALENLNRFPSLEAFLACIPA